MSNLAEKIDPSNNNQLRVLIIEDNTDFAFMIKQKLEDFRPQWKVQVSTSAEQAYQYLKSESEVDIILIDLNLPNMSGLEVCKNFITNFHDKRLFLMTGYNDIYTEIETRVYGVEKLFNKPFEVEKFIEDVENPKVKNKKDHIIPIELERIIPHKILPFDLYVSFSFKDKVIKFFKAGEEINKERIQQLIDNGHLFLFCDREDYIDNFMDIYIAVRVSTLVPNEPLTFKVSKPKDDKSGLSEFEMVKEKDTFFSKEEINDLKSKGIKKLFILDSDEKNYQEYIDRGLERILNDKTAGPQDKASVVHQYSIDKIQKAFSNPSNDTIYELNTVKGHLSQFLEGDDEGIKKLLAMDQGDDVSYQHALNVAALSYALFLKIAKEKEDGNKKLEKITLDKENSKEILTMAGLLHDIGENVLKMNMVEKNEKVSDEDIFNRHAEIGNEVLSKISGIHPKVREIILQHEEGLDGSGPMKLKKGSISTYGQILSLCNHYDRLVTKEKKSVDEALEEVQMNNQRYNSVFIGLLSEVIEDM
jgi:response regulator RpfG family c-di-GMP phosphodiesterase